MDFNKTSSFASVAARSTTYDASLRDYMVKVYNFMAIAMCISGATAFLVSSSPALMQLFFGTPLAWVVMFAPLGFVIFFAHKLQRISAQQAKNYLWIYSGLMGLSLATIFVVYTGTSIARTFFITASVFGGMAYYGYTTKKDLTSLGSFLIMGLLGLIIASLVNIFLQSSAMQFALSVIGTFLFIGLTAYDTQRVKQSYYHFAGAGGDTISKVAVMGALNLYMDFINLFLMLLHLFGDRRN
ncbi:MAG: Bax inhibitor-1/YccA family protein [Alphaproteobacteria bacterium]|nr:Bax inhibitor-1/YccA family protein [Alphaproteobacteria bacterium]